MNNSLKRAAIIVTSGTLFSKLGGEARQLAIAFVFGIGTAYDAYNYAYVLPGFFLILLGGINGPFHNSMVTVLTQYKKEEGEYIFTTINTIISFLLLLITIIIFFNAETFFKHELININ